MSIQGLVYLIFYAWFWFLVWACGITASIHLLQDFGVYFLLIEYLKAYFLVIGAIIVIFGIIALPATCTGIGVVLGLVIGFLYIFIKSILYDAYKILKYGPPRKGCIKNKKEKAYKQSQHNFSEDSQRKNSRQERNYSHSQQRSSGNNQSRQQEYHQQQSEERKPDLSMPFTVTEAYAVLGTQPGLTLEEYKRIWKKEALRYHPDKTRELGDRLQTYAEEEMKRINKAWEIIRGTV